MKKIIGVLLCLTMLAGCFPSQKGIVQTGAKEAVAAIEGEDDMILVIGKTSCGACEDFHSVMEEITNVYDIRITEVLMDGEEPLKDELTGEISYPEYEKLEQYIGLVGGTPSVYFIKGGVLKGAFTGAVSYETFQRKIEKYGFLPEEQEEGNAEGENSAE